MLIDWRISELLGRIQLQDVLPPLSFEAQDGHAAIVIGQGLPRRDAGLDGANKADKRSPVAVDQEIDHAVGDRVIASGQFGTGLKYAV